MNHSIHLNCSLDLDRLPSAGILHSSEGSGMAGAESAMFNYYNRVLRGTIKIPDRKAQTAMLRRIMHYPINRRLRALEALRREVEE